MRKRALIMLSLLTLLAPGVLTVAGCEPSLTLQVDNRTDENLAMTVDGIQYSDALPKTVTTVKTGIWATLSKHYVEGVNKSGDVVFVRYYSIDEQQDTRLKVTIPSKEEIAYSLLEFQNTTSDRIGIYIEQAFIGLVPSGDILKKRLLPSNVPSYKIEVYSQPLSYRRGVTHIGPAKKLINNTFSREQLEERGWKIVVTDP
jgi:hypothetical protein